MLNDQILNGSKYALFCVHIRGLMLATKRIAAFLLMQFTGSCALVRNGAFCPMNMALGTAFTSDLPAFDFERLLADKSYDVETFIQQLVALGVEVVIPPRANRKDQREYDKHW